MPSSDTEDQSVFILGITLGGAISAGAYSAGVFDFLVQALEEWELARAREATLSPADRTVPSHRVVIPVISGASAGGAVAALLPQPEVVFRRTSLE